MKIKAILPISSTVLCLFIYPMTGAQTNKTGTMKLNDQEYLEYGSINVMLAHDFYPEK